MEQSLAKGLPGIEERRPVTQLWPAISSGLFVIPLQRHETISKGILQRWIEAKYRPKDLFHGHPAMQGSSKFQCPARQTPVRWERHWKIFIYNSLELCVILVEIWKALKLPSDIQYIPDLSLSFSSTQWRHIKGTYINMFLLNFLQIYSGQTRPQSGNLQIFPRGSLIEKEAHICGKVLSLIKVNVF